ncbi:hypothetical protein [Flavobacterium coralii]|uniref:hypothetical protein n=1 Tax=Flavobacterium coralii TaxID=2838017 RepID=UPI0032B106B1|tara:strand:- start:18406 stop:20568 length:2163 start_codon:yes stop_codon:yes gene_type:complete
MNKKLLILLLSFYCVITNAQNSAEIKEMFWGANDEYKKATTIPEKWKNESAVVIYKNENYDYHKFGTNVTYISSVRKRVKLLDQAAVTEFSEFSFKERFYSSRGVGFTFRKAENTIGIKVIKPDGSEREIDVKAEAVNMDEGKKIAISNLEVGDIIDFYFYAEEPFKSIYEYGFEPVETSLGDEYPVMNMKITFKTENDFFVNFNSYNGAPELKQTSDPKSKNRSYELVATDIEKNDFPRWFFPLAEVPCYKFQVFFARSGKFEERASAFLPEKESIVKKTVSADDVLDFYDARFWPQGDISEIKNFVKNRDFKSDEEMVREVYYYTRHQYYTRYVEAFVVKEANIMYPFDLYGYAPVFFTNEIQFINHFMAFLKWKDINYEIVVATPRYNGSIKDLLIEKNTIIMIKANTANPVYLQFFSPYTNADQINPYIENTEAYALQAAKGKVVNGIKTIQLPSSTHKDNISKEKIYASMAADFSSVNVKRESEHYGHNKDQDQDDKMYFFDYVAEDYAKYGTTPLLELVRSKKKKEQYTNEFDALKNKLRDKQKEEFEKSLEGELGFEVDDHKLEIVNTGRFGKNTAFSYKEDFTVKNNLLKSAGSNYVFEIGKLIGQQVEIDEKEQKRTNNIYFPYPRSFEETIEFTVPDGYTVAGLDKLNKKVENSTGGFVSTATLNGNKLTVKAYKYYANYFTPNSNWKDMLAFLDAAYQFTQEKVLIKKI